MTGLIDTLILPHLTICGRSKKTSEVFFLAYEDDCGHFRFESSYELQNLEQGKSFHQLITLNSFYRKPRNLNTLHTLYALWIDIDGDCEPLPLSHLDVLERWLEIGFPKPPTEIIQTSVGHFHILLALQPLRAFPEKISFWKVCAEGLALLFKELGADMGATTNPICFMRIPGHVNSKHYDKPVVETVFESESVFTLSEIYGVLQELGLVKRPKKFSSHSDIQEKIKILRQGKFPDNGSRTNNHVCLTLAIYYKTQGLTEEEIFENLSDWNTLLSEPLQEKEIQQILKYTFHKNYSLSLKWLDWLTTPRPETSNLHNRKRGREPKRTHLKDHADKIRAYLASHGGSISIAQREFAKVLNVPFESLRKSLKLLDHELTVTANGRGRHATTIITLKEYRKCALRIVS